MYRGSRKHVLDWTGRSSFIEEFRELLGELPVDWQREPFRWARERDIQAEIGGRLSQVLSLQGLGSVKGWYGHGRDDFLGDQALPRVAYESYVPYVDPEKSGVGVKWEKTADRHFRWHCRAEAPAPVGHAPDLAET